ncbi:VOC family protein [Nocardioides sp.]|uniref:VOC family protein n=1 Tax=Nocardioides sp. TaxID=35761 RepID=UPI002ED5907D
MALVQVAQRAGDLERAARFYTQLLGKEPSATYDPPGLLFFDLDGVRLLLEERAPSSLLYLRVDDIDAEVARLEALGVEFTGAPHAIFRHEDDTLGPAGTEEWHAFLTDSEANTVGLVELRRVES